MMLTLVETESPRWTHAAIDHALSNATAYGLAVTPEVEEFAAEQRRAIDAGTPGEREYPPKTRVYAVEVDGAGVGELTMSFRRRIPELDVSIYRNYAGRGNGAAAVTGAVAILAGEGHAVIEANIRHENPDKLPIRALLGRCGFAFIGNATEVEVWRWQASPAP